MEVFKLFYSTVAPWLEPIIANTETLTRVAGANPTLEALTEAAKSCADSLAVKSNKSAYPQSATVAARNLALDTNLQKALAMEREQLKQEITQGKSTFTFRTPNGTRKVYSSETGHEMSYSSNGPRRSTEPKWWDTVDIQTLRLVHSQIMAERGYRATPTEKLSVDSIRASQSPQQQAEDVVLTHPDSGEPFTKQTLIKYLNAGSASEHTRRILVINNKVDAARERAFFKLLGKI
jgi:guanyl-specific ribonuclease Sa